MTIPFFNYSTRFAQLPAQLPDLITQHCESGQFILKQSVASFEQQIAHYLQQKASDTQAICCAATSSASFGLIIALKASGIGPGDEVITPAYSYVSTASAIVSVGATPVFVDVDPTTFMLCASKVSEKVTSRTRAVIAVHLYSKLMSVAALRAVLPERVLIVEDSATCLGGQAQGTPAGLMGDIGVYSFFPAKPLGGLGDGGMIVTRDRQLHRKCMMLRNHGQDGRVRFTHFALGYNSRMDDINAAFLERKLPLLDENNARRRVIVQCYDQAVTESGWHNQQSAFQADEVTEVPYSYVFLATKAEELIAYLNQQGIEAKRGFPLPLTSQPAFSAWAENAEQFVHARDIAQRAVALPLYPELSNQQVSEVVDALYAFGSRHD